MFQFVFGNVGFGGWVETSEDGGGNCIASFNPGEEVCRDVLKFLPTFSRAQRERRTLEYDLTRERALVMNSVRG